MELIIDKSLLFHWLRKVDVVLVIQTRERIIVVLFFTHQVLDMSAEPFEKGAKVEIPRIIFDVHKRTVIQEHINPRTMPMEIPHPWERPTWCL